MSDNFELFLEQVKIYQEVERIRMRRKIILTLVLLSCIIGGVYYYFY